jgi:hypothetical protein
MEAVNLDVMLARFAEHWSPKKIAQVNDYDVSALRINMQATRAMLPWVPRDGRNADDVVSARVPAVVWSAAWFMLRLSGAAPN